MGHLKSEFVWAHESVLTSPIRSKRYQAPGQSAFLILKGGMEVETDAGKLHVGAGHWCFPHQGPRWLRAEVGAHLLSIRSRLYWPGGQPLFNSPIATVIEARAAPMLEKRARALIHVVSRAVPGAKADLPWRKTDLPTYFRLLRAFDAWLYAYVETMLATGVAPSRLAMIDPRVLRVITKLDELPLDQGIDDSVLSAESGLSLSQLSRLFVQQVKLTPRQYFEGRKLTLAKTLIRSSPLAIKQVAYETGFGSLPAFSRWFHQQTGQSPRDFRQREQV